MTLANPISLSGGRDHSCAVDSGQVVCWGGNDFGQLHVVGLGIGESPKETSGAALQQTDRSGRTALSFVIPGEQLPITV